MDRGTIRGEAMKLRLRGYSYNEIRNTLRVPKSTLSGWFRDLILSKSAQDRLNARIGIGTAVLIRRNRKQTQDAQKRAYQIQSEASARIPVLDKKDLLLLGTALYWAEGYKRLRVRDGKTVTAHTISFVNSDPDMIRVFIRFLTEILDVKPDDIRLTMRLYAHINEQEAFYHWTGITGLNTGHFHKTTYLVTGASKGSRPFNRLPYGVLQVAVYSTEQFHRLMGLLAGVKKQVV